jgi:hypothetical protein
VPGLGRPLGVVEDQQPPIPVAQLGEQPADGVGHGGPQRQAEPLGESG